MDDELLIELVRRQTVLYDYLHPKYIDSKLKNRIWNSIGQELKVDGSSCKTRWTNIRDQYRKNMKKNAATGGQNPKRIKLYKYCEQLSFLKDYFQEREPKGNIDNQESETETKFRPEDDEMNYTQDSNSELAGLSTSPYFVKMSSPTTSLDLSPDPLVSPPSPVSAPKSKKSIKNATAETTLMEYLLQKNESAQQHPIDAFLAGIVPTLKGLSPYLQNQAKSEIFATVQKYELLMLDNDELSTSSSANHNSTSRIN